MLNPDYKKLKELVKGGTAPLNKIQLYQEVKDHINLDTML